MNANSAEGGLSAGEPSLATSSTEGKMYFCVTRECMFMLLLIYLACLVNEAMRCVLLKHASDSPTQLCFGTSNAQTKVPPYRFSLFSRLAHSIATNKRSVGGPLVPTMSSSSDSSSSSVDDASERERQEAEEDFRQMCASL